MHQIMICDNTVHEIVGNVVFILYTSWRNEMITTQSMYQYKEHSLEQDSKTTVIIITVALG